ncbi:Hypothetical predicted protein, partial [Pelobates cultripes]
FCIRPKRWRPVSNAIGLAVLALFFVDFPSHKKVASRAGHALWNLQRYFCHMVNKLSQSSDINLLQLGSVNCDLHKSKSVNA